MKTYSFSKGLGKAVISAVLFAIPIFITSFPDWANLTIGGGLMLIYNFIKVKMTSIS